MREYARFFKDRKVGCENSLVNDTGVQVGVRQTRQIRGVEMLVNGDVVSGVRASLAAPSKSLILLIIFFSGKS